MIRVMGEATYNRAQGIVEASPLFDERKAPLLSPAIVTFVEKKQLFK